MSHIVISFLVNLWSNCSCHCDSIRVLLSGISIVYLLMMIHSSGILINQLLWDDFSHVSFTFIEKVNVLSCDWIGPFHAFCLPLYYFRCIDRDLYPISSCFASVEVWEDRSVHAVLILNHVFPCRWWWLLLWSVILAHKVGFKFIKWHLKRFSIWLNQCRYGPQCLPDRLFFSIDSLARQVF